jgi:predicted phage baseplate assembly protein
VVLPAPNLDDRRFQQLVDDAKRMVQQRCPRWTDHNVSDPGVTLIETFAFMVDQLLYRLNRVPDRNYVKFLELIGVRLFPPAAARADVTFWLSAPQEETVRIPVGTEVGTTRTGLEESVVFAVVEDRDIPPCAVENVLSGIEDGRYREHMETLAARQSFYCFDEQPKAGDALYVGLSVPVPGCAVSLDLDCDIEGVGVDPRYPPLVWEAWDGEGWVPCDLERDGTGGLNRAGEVVIHVPRGHEVSVLARQRAAWVRCRVVEPWEGQPFYSASPRVTRIAATTVGGTTETVHAELVPDEIIGLSEGVPGQRFPLKHSPVVTADAPYVIEVAAGDGWEEWTAVDSFADSGPDDRHFILDATNGEVSFGPSVREADGSLHQYGAVPPKGAPMRMGAYRVGGGVHGNVTSGVLNVVKSSMPYVASVTNRRPAVGGVDGEDIENAKVRGPIVMRTRGRAVTPEDYEQLARAAAPEAARIRCAPAGTDGTDAGAVRILVVPRAQDELGRLRFDQLLPSDETLERIAAHLDERRMIGARVLVEPPTYQGITIVARLRARSRTGRTRLQAHALQALYGYFHPVTGGPDGDGWPFGRPVHVGEVYSTLQRLDGVEFVEEASLFPADPISGDRGKPVQRIELSEHALVFSFEHSVMVEES